MKRFLKACGALVLSFVLLLAMTSCSEYDFYEDWHGAGAAIEKDNIFETISLEKAAEMKEDGKVFALVYASSSAATSRNVITSLQVQAEYLGCEDAVVYYVNSTDYYGSSTTRKEVKSIIGMHEAPSDGSPVIMTFKNGRVDVDTSDMNKTKTKEFIKNGIIQYASLASYIFRELHN